MRQRYIRGGLAYSEIKQGLFELLEDNFSQAREKYEDLMKDWGYLDRVLLEGAEKARDIGKPMMEKVRKAVGVD
jgi:tryptophanyl-tRNA synthetase